MYTLSGRLYHRLAAGAEVGSLLTDVWKLSAVRPWAGLHA